MIRLSKLLVPAVLVLALLHAPARADDAGRALGDLSADIEEFMQTDADVMDQRDMLDRAFDAGVPQDPSLSGRMGQGPAVRADRPWGHIGPAGVRMALDRARAKPGRPHADSGLIIRDVPRPQGDGSYRAREDDGEVPPAVQRGVEGLGLGLATFLAFAPLTCMMATGFGTAKGVLES